MPVARPAIATAPAPWTTSRRRPPRGRRPAVALGTRAASKAATRPTRSTPPSFAARYVASLCESGRRSKRTSRSIVPAAGSPSPTRLTETTTSDSVPIAFQSRSCCAGAQSWWSSSGMRWTPAEPLISRVTATWRSRPGSAARADGRTMSTPPSFSPSGNPLAQTPAAAPGGMV